MRLLGLPPESYPGLATLAFRASPLVYVGSVSTVDVTTRRTLHFVGVLEVICATHSMVHTASLPVRIHVPDPNGLSVSILPLPLVSFSHDRFDYLLVESTGISEPWPVAEPRLGRRTVLTFPLLPPPQKN